MSIYTIFSTSEHLKLFLHIVYIKLKIIGVVQLLLILNHLIISVVSRISYLWIRTGTLPHSRYHSNSWFGIIQISIQLLTSTGSDPESKISFITDSLLLLS